MRRLALLCATLAACYEPEAVNCTVECSQPGDCADGQVCGADHFCAAPDVAGMCGSTGEPASVSLVIVIDGPGKVIVDEVGTCDSETAIEGRCTYLVQAGAMVELKAHENSEREFISWTSTCSGSSSTCIVTAVMALTQVGAKFE